MEPIPIIFTHKKSGKVLKFNTPQEALDYGFSPEKIQAKLEATKKLQTSIETGDPFAMDPKMIEQKQKEDDTKQAKSEAVELAGELLNRDTGAVTGLPNPLKYLTGENQYTKALIDQLKAKLSVEARSKMKGTGQISDYESQLLAKSVSALNYGMSNEDFKTELGRIMDVLDNKEPRKTGADKPSYMNELVGNIPKNAQSTLQGLLSTGKLFAQNTPPMNTISQLQQILTGKPSQPQIDAQNMVKNIPGAILNDVGQLVSDPAGYVKNKPVDTALMLLPFLKGTGLLNKSSKATQAAGVADTANVANKTSLVQKLAGASKKLKSVKPSSILSRKKAEAFDMYKDVSIDTGKILKAGEEFVKKYPEAKKYLERYRKSIQVSKDPKTLDESLKEWGDAYTKGKDVKPGLLPDLLNRLYSAGRQELETKAPEVAAYKTLMGEMIDFNKGASKALFKATLGKLLLGGV